MCLAKVKTGYIVASSKRAKTVFEKHAAHHEIDKLLDIYLKLMRWRYGPLKLATEISDPTEAYERLKTLQFISPCIRSELALQSLRLSI